MKNIIFKAPDISQHQGIVNIKSVRDSGYPAVFMRAGYGKNNTDQKFQSNATACYNLSVPVMIYWFSYAYSVAMAAEEGKYAVEHAKKYWKFCPIAYDLEYDTVKYASGKGVRIDKKLATDMAVAFLKEVQNAGYIPVIYTNEDYWKNYFDIERIYKEIGAVYIWYARYSNSIPVSRVNAVDIWQYTSKGSIPGISGNVDVNNVYSDLFGKTEPLKSEKPTSCNLYVLEFQKAANADGYRDQNSNKLVEDGKPGPKTEYVAKRINLKAKKTLLSYTTGSKGYLVEWVQKRCNDILHHNNPVDKYYGKDTKKEVMEVQKKLNLPADGVAGYNTITMMFYN